MKQKNNEQCMQVESPVSSEDVGPFISGSPPHRRFRPRSLWLNVHFYIGITLGLLFVILGLTGSINVFYLAIDEFLHPELMTEADKGEPKPVDEIMNSLKKDNPERNGSWMLIMPRKPGTMIDAWYMNPDEKKGEFFAPLVVSVNPYTAEVVRSNFWGDTLMTWIYNLHASLLMDETGFKIVGILGALLLVSLVTGMYLWWPRGGKYRLALTIKRGANPMRFNLDLHRVSGAYFLLILIVIAFSGIYFVYPDYIKPLVSPLTPVGDEPVGLVSTRKTAATPITISRAVEIAYGVFPDAKLRIVTTPEDENGVYKIDMRQRWEPNKIFTRSSVWLDQYSGDVLYVRDPKKSTAGETFLSWQWPLHNGEAFGLPGRIIVFLTGFIPLILYITGIRYWLLRRKARVNKEILRGRNV